MYFIKYFLNKKLANTGFTMGVFSERLEDLKKEDLFKIYPYIFNTTPKKTYIRFTMKDGLYFVTINTNKKEKDFLCLNEETYQKVKAELKGL